MSEKIVHITDASFQSTLEEAGDKPVFVDFWAPWCGPCRMLAPSLDAAADAYDGKALICKYNVDENSSVASANGIRGIPPILVYKSGQLVDQHVGAMGRSELNAFIEKFI